MDEIYNWDYYKTYTCESYENTDFWSPIFERFARLIVDSLNPRTVLDVGCATGYLVAALRDLGVGAYGVDISQAAISHCREDIRPYLMVHSLLDEDTPVGFPKHFDLATNSEVLEHLYEDETEKALAKLCTFSDHVLFSSSPRGITDVAHLNVRQPEHWTRLFATQGFFRTMTADFSAFTPDAIYFTRRSDVDVPRILEDYEHRLRLVKDSWRRPEPGFYSALLFGYINGVDTENPGSRYSPTNQLDWASPLPQGATEVIFSRHWSSVWSPRCIIRRRIICGIFSSVCWGKAIPTRSSAWPMAWMRRMPMWARWLPATPRRIAAFATKSWPETKEFPAIPMWRWRWPQCLTSGFWTMTIC